MLDFGWWNLMEFGCFFLNLDFACWIFMDFLSLGFWILNRGFVDLVSWIFVDLWFGIFWFWSLDIWPVWYLRYVNYTWVVSCIFDFGSWSFGFRRWSLIFGGWILEFWFWDFGMMDFGILEFGLDFGNLDFCWVWKGICQLDWHFDIRSRKRIPLKKKWSKSYHS